MARGDQLARQWRLLHILGARGGCTVEELAREVRCSVRTAWRDLALLQEVGFPLTCERDGRESRYMLIQGPRGLPPIPFTLTELMGLHLGRHLLAPLHGTPAGDSIRNALDKIAATLAPHAKSFLDGLDREISARFVQTKDYREAGETIGVIQDAIRQQRSLEADYHSFGRDVLTHRRLNPLHLWYQQGGVYLAAFCHRRREVRTFAVERLRRVRPTGDAFQPPAGFDIDRYLAGSFGLFRGRSIRVVLRFSKAVARYIAERKWHPTQVLAPLLGGELDLTLQAPVCPDLLRWILSYGKDVDVLEPRSIRQAIRREWLAALRGAGGRAEAPRPPRKAPRPYAPTEPRPVLAAAEASGPLRRSGRQSGGT